MTKELLIESQTKKTSLSDNTPIQPSKFSTKNWVEINDDKRGAYNIDSQIKFQN